MSKVRIGTMRDQGHVMPINIRNMLKKTLNIFPKIKEIKKDILKPQNPVIRGVI